MSNSKEIDLKFLYNDIKEQLQRCYRDRLIKFEDYTNFIKEMDILFPYINYSSLNKIIIKPELIENKLLIIQRKLRELI